MTLAMQPDASTAQAVKAELEALKAQNLPTYGPKMFRPSYFAGQDVVEVAEAAYALFIKENWLYGRTTYPAVGKFEDEILETLFELLHAPRTAGGILTSGGTESLILSVKLARDSARKAGRRGEPFNIVLPHSAHPAFEKAADLLSMEVRRAPADVDFSADLAWMDQACDERTVMIVGSAPPYPYGQIDPLREIAAIAREKDLWFHVDACLGGTILPFLEMLGVRQDAFDFRLPEVKSLSLDLHKCGYAVKGISALILRNDGDEAYGRTVFSDWPAGLYATPGISGTRSAGAAASAWAVMRYLGKSGYLERTGKIWSIRNAFIEKLERIGATILGRPDCYHFNFAMPQIDNLILAEELGEAGWIVSSTEKPASVQLMITAAHEGIAGQFSDEVDLLAREIAAGKRKGTGKGAVYSKVVLRGQKSAGG